MWLHTVDLDGFDKIPNVLQLNRNKRASFLLSVSIQKLILKFSGVGLFVLLALHKFFALCKLNTMVWLTVTVGKSEIIFH